MNIRLLALFGLCSALFCAAPALAADSAPNATQRVCGAYRYDIQRIVDGFLIKVTDAERVRQMFYQDIFNVQNIFPTRTHFLSQCQGTTLIAEQSASSTHGDMVNLQQLDPTKPKLAFTDIFTRETDPSGTITDTPTSTSELEALLATPTDGWSNPSPTLITKIRIPTQNDFAADRSYFIFSADHKSVIKKSTPSYWNNAWAQDSITCNGVTYTLYDKRFAENDTTTSTYPADQFVIERSTKQGSKLIPVPYTDGYWKKFKSLFPALGNCYGKNIAVQVQSAIENVDGSLNDIDQVTLISDKTAFVDYLNPKTSIAYDLVTNHLYYKAGLIWHATDGIKGDATITTLNTDGSVTRKKPPFFQNLMDYPVGSSMEFRKDPQNDSNVAVILMQSSSTDVLQPRTQSKFVETSGEYIESPNLVWNDAYANFHWGMQSSPLYLSSEKTGLVVKSYPTPISLLLHGTGGKDYHLEWYRIGPLEADGSRKIRYAINIDNKIQTWSAVLH